MAPVSIKKSQLLERDTKLHPLESANFFEANTTKIALRKGYFLRGFVYDFIEMCSLLLDEAKVRQALKSKKWG